MEDEWTDDESDTELIIQSDSDSGIEAPSRPPSPEPTPEPEPEPAPPPKPKRKMTEKQLAALAAGRAKRDKGRAERKSAKDEKLAIRKANLEKRTKQKAIRIKKNELLEEAALVLSDENSGDELEAKMVKRLLTKRKAKAKAKHQKK